MHAVVTVGIVFAKTLIYARPAASTPSILLMLYCVRCRGAIPDRLHSSLLPAGARSTAWNHRQSIGALHHSIGIHSTMFVDFVSGLFHLNITVLFRFGHVALNLHTTAIAQTVNFMNSLPDDLLGLSVWTLSCSSASNECGIRGRSSIDAMRILLESPDLRFAGIKNLY
jgi:hypothetical protein